MNANDDEWRIRVDVTHGSVRDVVRAIEQVAPFDFKGGTRARYPVSHSDEHVFIYASSEAAALNAAREVAAALAEHDLDDAVSLSRWHPLEERWEDASVPLPRNELDEQREHERREALETERSGESGFDEWEVRITLPTRADAVALVRQLRDEGVSVTRGFRHVLAGAADEDDARALAQRLRQQAPEGSLLHVEPSGAEAWQITHPFAVFGGLGG